MVLAAQSPVLRSCTFFGNEAMVAGASIYVTSNGDVRVDESVFAFDTGGGSVRCLPGHGKVTLWCCDVFGNVGGDWLDCIADQGNINGNFSADPLFCAPESGDFTLMSNSPCAPPGVTNCGLVGALPVGCGPVSVVEESWAGIKAKYRGERQ